MNEELRKKLLELNTKVAQKLGVGSSPAPAPVSVPKPATPSTSSYSKDLVALNERVAQKLGVTPVAPQPTQYSSYSEKLAKEDGVGFAKDVANEAKLSINRIATSGNPFQGVIELGKLGKVLAQGFGSFVANVAQEGAEQITKVALPKQYEEDAVQKVRDTFEKIVPGFVTGGAPIESYTEWGERQQKQIEEDPSSTEWEKKNLAPILVAGMVLTDWFPGGRAAKSGASNIFRDISTLKNKTPEVISTILTKNNVPKELIEELAPKIINAKSVEEVDSLIKNRVTEQFNKVNNESGLVEAVAKREEGLVAPKTYDDYLAMSKDRPEVMSKMDRDMLETLTEARKYDAFDDYVKSRGEVVYRGGEGFGGGSFTTSKFIADDFAKNRGGEVVKYTIQPDAKILDYNDVPDVKYKDEQAVNREIIMNSKDKLSFMENELEAEYKKAQQYAHDNGYDVLKLPTENELRVINKDVVKSETELKDTWDKSHDKIPKIKQPEQPLDFQFGEPKKTIEDTISEVQKDYTGTRERRWEKQGVIDIAKRLGSGFELPAIFFEKRGLAKTIYDPVRDAQGRAEVARTAILKKFADKGLFKRGGVFTLGGFNLSKKEADDMGRYMLARQGKGYEGYTFEKLTPHTKEMVRTFDEVIKDLEPEFRKAADDIGIDVGKVDNYGPLMTKDDVKVVDDGIQPQWLLPYEVFGSTKKRVDEVPLNLYETDYRLIMQRWIHGITDFNNVAPQTKRVKEMLDTDAIKNTLNDKDMGVAQKFISDITTPDVPKTDAGKLAVTVNRYARRAQAIAALGYNVKTILKQPLAVIAATVIEKAPPKFRSEYAKAFGVNVKDLPSVSIRGGDINAFNDIRSGSLMQLPFQPLKRMDQKTAEKILNGYLDKEWKAVGKSNALSPEMMAHIEREAQKKLDMLMGGYFPGQRPANYTSELGNTLLMFTYPLTSQLNTFFYHVYKGKTTPDKAKRIAEVMTSIALIAYFEQVVTNLSFNWDSEEDMVKDVLISASGNIPILGGMVYAAANPGVDYSPIPVVSNINKIKEKVEEGKFEKAAWETAHLLGVPKSFRRGIEGAEVIDEGGAKSFEVATLPEQIRTAVGGEYGSLAGKEYLENLNNPKGEKAVKELRKLPPEEAKTKYLEIKRTDPALARSIKKQLTDEKLGITKKDKEFRNMGIESGERARHIYNNLEDFDTKEEKVAYLKDLQTKKILTKDTLTQLKELLKKD